MAFDSTQGSTTQNSYVTIAEADDYIVDRGGCSDWETSNKQAALIKATDYIERNYSHRWNTGEKANSTQRLSWPRNNAYYPDEYGATYIAGVPREVKEAVYEMAIEVVQATNNNVLPKIERETKSEQVGSLKVVYMDRASATTTYPKVEGLLAPLVETGAVRLSRSN